MKKEIISNALSNIDDTYIEEAANYSSMKKKKYRYFLLPAAACLCIIFISGIIKFMHTGTDAEAISSENNDYIILNKAPEEYKNSVYGIEIPITPIEIDPYSETSYIACLEYNDRMYSYHSIFGNNSLLGEKLGHSIACFDEYGHPTGSNSTVTGDFYAVKGYDSDFMVCMPLGENQLKLFVMSSGFCLSYGEDIFEARLHLSDRYKTIFFQSRDEWYYEQGQRMLLPEYHAAINQYLELFNNSKWIYSEPVISDKIESYHMYFQLEDGITVHLRLYEDGYVIFDGIYSVCIQINKEDMQELLLLLENQGDSYEK